MKFPFGQALKPVIQKDQSPKKVFVLGVYASAVHARWLNPDGKQIVSAFAVASEPDIFWRGDGAEEIISSIDIPKEAGSLVLPSNKSMNGPSGKVLDEQFLKPLGFTREDAWLCDLLPESRVNPKQEEVIRKKYYPVKEKLGLNEAAIPIFSKKELGEEGRMKNILQEIKASKAEYLLLLGDLPIYHLLYKMGFSKKKRLAEFGETDDTYSREHLIDIEGVVYKVIPLCHPRQAGRLGISSSKWGRLHENWERIISKTV